MYGKTRTFGRTEYKIKSDYRGISTEQKLDILDRMLGSIAKELSEESVKARILETSKKEE